LNKYQLIGDCTHTEKMTFAGLYLRISSRHTEGLGFSEIVTAACFRRFLPPVFAALALFRRRRCAAPMPPPPACFTAFPPRQATPAARGRLSCAPPPGCISRPALLPLLQQAARFQLPLPLSMLIAAAVFAFHSGWHVLFSPAAPEFQRRCRWRRRRVAG